MGLPVTAPAGPVAVSACLMGYSCRYNGASRACEAVAELAKERVLVPICPEQLGGLPTPRAAAEIVRSRNGQCHVRTEEGDDLTAAYAQGAARALSAALDAEVGCAVFKENSPSCGSGCVYDGTFSGGKISGMGITAQLFIDADIPVFSESDVV
jgi:uncharacterized protein YbbK (DUF523 family)